VLLSIASGNVRLVNHGVRFRAGR
jgi:hypothetical protein